MGDPIEAGAIAAALLVPRAQSGALLIGGVKATLSTAPVTPDDVQNYVSLYAHMP